MNLASLKEWVKTNVPFAVKARVYIRRAWSWAVDMADEARWVCGGRRGVVFSIQSDVRIRAHPTAWRRSYFAFAEGGYCEEEFRNFIRHCTPGMALYDVGAQFGIFSLAALLYGGEEARAFACEPSPRCVDMLERIRRLNGLDAQRLTIVPTAIGSHQGRVAMRSYGVLGGHQYLADRDGALLAPQATLDAVVTETGVPPTHIKIDVEGYEDAVLEGAASTLRRFHPKLFVEIHPGMLEARGVPVGSVEGGLKGLGYRLKWEDRSDPVAVRSTWIYEGDL